MAENNRTQTAAAIKRASEIARRSANKLDKKVLDELTALYNDTAERLRQSIASYVSSDGRLTLSVLNNLLEQVSQQLDAMATMRNQLLDDSMTISAQLAVSAIAPGIGIATTQIANDAVLQIHKFIAEDGLQLSDRLWRLDNHAKQVVADAIQSAVIQGNSATQAALDLISTGQSVPRDLAAKMLNASGDKVSKSVIAALMNQKGSPYDNALRVFRTEINRAHGNAYQATAFDHPDVIGTRFLLSPNHPRHDICDMHASANLYGLGPGVYPKDKNPWPAHPNTLSYVEAVFSDEVTADDKAGKVDRISWLEQQSVTRQNRILGVHKGWMLREGRLRENAIKTPWGALKKRLEKAGVEIPDNSGLFPSLPLNSKVSIVDVIEANTHYQQVDTALSAIDSVHSVRGLPAIGVIRTSGKKVHGHYHPKGEIGLSSDGDHPELTLAHEVGHFIDHRGFFGSEMSSVDSIAMQAWRDAVKASPEIQNLIDIGLGKFNAQYNKAGVAFSKKHIKYLIDPVEIWARSYAQWIASKSKSTVMNQQLSQMVKRQQGAVIKYTSQWEEENFKPISDAIDDVFSTIGWLK